MKNIYNFILGLVIAVTIISSFLLGSYAWAFGLGVNPGKIVLKNIPAGKKVALSKFIENKTKLQIQNESDVAYKYTIEVLPTAKTTAPVNEGYQDIPDVSWIEPESKEIEVGAKSTKEIDVFLNIPKKYENKNFQAVIEVKTKKNKPEDVFVLACQVEILISTEADKKTKTKRNK